MNNNLLFEEKVYTIDEIVSNEVNKYLVNNQRIISIKLPTNEVFSGSLRVPNFDLFYCKDENNKLLYRPKSTKKLINWFIWLSKTILFILQCIFSWPISAMTIFSLSIELVTLSKNSFRKNVPYNEKFFKSLTRHIKIKRNPCTDYKKIKKVIYLVIDDKTPIEQLNSALLLADLINNKYVTDSAIVILSKVSLLRPQQTLLFMGEMSEEDSRFANDFGRDILKSIRKEDYVSATRYLTDFITKQGVKNLSVFNFAMQCLAFCFNNLNDADFKKLFLNHSFNLQPEITFGIDQKFLEYSKTKQNFLKFCYSHLLQYYRNIAGIRSAEYNIPFFEIIEDIKNQMLRKNEYFSAAQLYSKFATTENSVDAFIIAFVHSELIENTISDECLLAIKQYKSTSEKASLFLQLYDLSLQETPSVNEIKAIIDKINELVTDDPILRLCYYYFLVNPVYKSDCLFEKFLSSYRTEYSKIQAGNDAFKCLFGAQFLLLYTTIEDVQLHKQYAKFVSQVLPFVIEKKELLKEKNIYVRICRNLNGIAVDDFHNNLEVMQNVEKHIEIKDKERINFLLNLGVMYAYCGNYAKAKDTYKKIDLEKLKCLPLSIRSTYINNLAVFRYRQKPNIDTAKRQYKELSKYYMANYDNLITEETKHIAINISIFSILSNTDRNIISKDISLASSLCDDNYFKFYMKQVRLLNATINRENFIGEATEDSVFFTNKKSFFEQKYNILEKAQQLQLKSVKEINSLLYEELSTYDKNYDFFKYVDMFSLIERWYE